MNKYATFLHGDKEDFLTHIITFSCWQYLLETTVMLATLL